MSLINRMLNDLEERQAQSSAVDAGILNGVSPAIKADRGSSALARILSWTPAAIGFLATVYAGYLYLDSHGVASLSSLQRVNTTAGFAAQPPKEDDVASGPAVGTGLDSGEPPVTGLDGVLTLRLSNAVVGMQGRPRAVSKENAEDRSMPAPILYGPGRPSAQRADSSDLEELSRAIRAPSPASAEMRLTLNAPRSGPAAGHVPATPEAVPEVRKTPVPMAPETKAEADYRAGLAHLRLGELVAGEDRLRQALAVNPEHIKAREVLAAHLVRQQRLERAGYLLADGLQRVPEASNLAKLYARILVEQGQLDDAVEVLARASPPVQSDPDYHALKAALLQRRKDHEGAAALYRTVLLVEPDAGLWWMGLGISLEVLGNAKDALHAFQRARKSGVLSGKVLEFVKAKERALENERLRS